MLKYLSRKTQHTVCLSCLSCKLKYNNKYTISHTVPHRPCAISISVTVVQSHSVGRFHVMNAPAPVYEFHNRHFANVSLQSVPGVQTLDRYKTERILWRVNVESQHLLCVVWLKLRHVTSGSDHPDAVWWLDQSTSSPSRLQTGGLICPSHIWVHNPTCDYDHFEMACNGSHSPHLVVKKWHFKGPMVLNTVHVNLLNIVKVLFVWVDM